MHSFPWWGALILDLITSLVFWFLVVVIVFLFGTFIVRKVRSARRKPAENLKVVVLAPEFKDSHPGRG